VEASGRREAMGEGRSTGAVCVVWIRSTEREGKMKKKI